MKILLLLMLVIIVLAMLGGAAIGRMLLSAMRVRRLAWIFVLVCCAVLVGAVSSMSIEGSWPVNGGRSLIVISRRGGLLAGATIGLAVLLGGLGGSWRRLLSSNHGAGLSGAGRWEA